jgi:hypothetical protein
VICFSHFESTHRITRQFIEDENIETKDASKEGIIHKINFVFAYLMSVEIYKIHLDNKSILKMHT